MTSWRRRTPRKSASGDKSNSSGGIPSAAAVPAQAMAALRALNTPCIFHFIRLLFPLNDNVKADQSSCWSKSEIRKSADSAKPTFMTLVHGAGSREATFSSSAFSIISPSGGTILRTWVKVRLTS